MAQDPPGARVVVCDADSASARFLEHALERAGFATVSCQNAAACEAELAAWPARLLVLSILLPDVDGFSLVRRIRATHGSSAVAAPIRIIMVSVLQAEQRALEAGADAFLLKPVAADTLVSVATRLVARTVHVDD